MADERDYLLRGPAPPIKPSRWTSIVRGLLLTSGIIVLVIGVLKFGAFVQPRPAYDVDLLSIPTATTTIARSECKEDKSTSTLKVAYDIPFNTLFRYTYGQTKFEASDVTILNDTVYAVCDNSWAIDKFARHATPYSTENILLAPPPMMSNHLNRVEGDSGYEAIFEYDGMFYAVRESVNLHAIIVELSLTDDTYTYIQECPCEYTFEGDNTGFEGAVGFPDKDGIMYVLGLCEGNYCRDKNKKSKDPGNGRVVLMKKRDVDLDANDIGCLWETVREVHIPKSAAFVDYSAIDITSNGRVAISSQESSSVWLGYVSGITDGVIDPKRFEFSDHDSSVLNFPRDKHCETIYCNVEGIHWINDDMLLAVSDRIKDEGRQNRRCGVKDQSIHGFVLP
jgi:hypothetical protein